NKIVFLLLSISTQIFAAENITSIELAHQSYYSFAVSKDNVRAYIGSSAENGKSTIEVVNLNEKRVIGKIDLPPGCYLRETLFLGQEDKKLYAYCQASIVI